MTDQETVDKFNNLDDELEDLKNRIQRQAGQQEQLDKRLKDLNFDNVKGAERELNRLRKKLDTMQVGMQTLFGEAQGVLNKIKGVKDE